MQDIELYADLVTSLVKWAHREVFREDFQPGLAPDAEGNNIAVTVWHISRWIDIVARMLPGRSNKEELWLTRGWAERTGYNPHGVGEQGLGAVTGYTLQEVAEIPLLSAQELLEYLDQVCEALGIFLHSLPSRTLAAAALSGILADKTTIAEDNLYSKLRTYGRNRGTEGDDEKEQTLFLANCL